MGYGKTLLQAEYGYFEVKQGSVEPETLIACNETNRTKHFMPKNLDPATLWCLEDYSKYQLRAPAEILLDDHFGM